MEDHPIDIKAERASLLSFGIAARLGLILVNVNLVYSPDLCSLTKEAASLLSR